MEEKERTNKGKTKEEQQEGGKGEWVSGRERKKKKKELPGSRSSSQASSQASSQVY